MTVTSLIPFLILIAFCIIEIDAGDKKGHNIIVTTGESDCKCEKTKVIKIPVPIPVPVHHHMMGHGYGMWRRKRSLFNKNIMTQIFPTLPTPESKWLENLKKKQRKKWLTFQRIQSLDQLYFVMSSLFVPPWNCLKISLSENFCLKISLSGNFSATKCSCLFRKLFIWKPFDPWNLLSVTTYFSFLDSIKDG